MMNYDISESRKMVNNLPLSYIILKYWIEEELCREYNKV